uniref:Fatty acid binding protein 6 n=1 Tax=Sus scrofa TaxID=9823 RepID=A0A8D0P4V1_PIG
MLLTLRLACRRAGKGIPQTTGYRHLLQAYELRLSPGPALPSDAIDKARNLKIISEVKQDGQNFTWSQQYPGGHSITNTFTIGKECDIETIGGKKFKATVQMEGGKVVVNSPNYHHTAEIVDGKLVEVSTVGGVSYERVSKKLA